MLRNAGNKMLDETATPCGPWCSHKHIWPNVHLIAIPNTEHKPRCVCVYVCVKALSLASEHQA